MRGRVSRWEPEQRWELHSEPEDVRTTLYVRGMHIPRGLQSRIAVKVLDSLGFENSYDFIIFVVHPLTPLPRPTQAGKMKLRLDLT